jgi:sarcosine oxidase subunit beta
MDRFGSPNLPKYSFLRLMGHALTRHRRWPRVLRDAAPKPAYDVVIVGGGGHGLATAYYLAKVHAVRNVAVLERTAIGHGNSGRNTQVTRSDYFHLSSSKFYDRSLQL